MCNLLSWDQRGPLNFWRDAWVSTSWIHVGCSSYPYFATIGARARAQVTGARLTGMTRGTFIVTGLFYCDRRNRQRSGLAWNRVESRRPCARSAGPLSLLESPAVESSVRIARTVDQHRVAERVGPFARSSDYPLRDGVDGVYDAGVALRRPGAGMRQRPDSGRYRLRVVVPVDRIQWRTAAVRR